MRVDATADGTAGDVDLAAFDPGDDALVAAYAQVQALKERGYPIINSNTFLARMQHLPLVYHCHWPKFIVPIEANGDVVDCMHWGRAPVDNVRNRPLREILRNPRLRQLAGPAGEACHQCRSVHRFEQRPPVEVHTTQVVDAVDAPEPVAAHLLPEGVEGTEQRVRQRDRPDVPAVVRPAGDHLRSPDLRALTGRGLEHDALLR